VAFWTNAVGACGLPLKPVASLMGHYAGVQGHRVVSDHDSCRSKGSWHAARRSEVGRPDSTARGGRKPLTYHAPDILQALDALVEPSTRGIQNRCCAGPARARADWRKSFNGKATVLETARWPTCFTSSTTAFRPMPKPLRGRSIRTEMPSLNTSTRWPSGFIAGPTGHIGGHQEKGIGGRL